MSSDLLLANDNQPITRDVPCGCDFILWVEDDWWLVFMFHVEQQISWYSLKNLICERQYTGHQLVLIYMQFNKKDD